MKKISKSKTFFITIIFVVTLIALFLGIFYMFNSKPKTYKTIDYNELVRLVDSNESFILFIGSDTCSHCNTFKITANEVVSEYGIEINYIDVGELSTEEYAYLNSRMSFSATPTTILVKEGDNFISDRVITKIKGAKNYTDFTNLLKKHNFIKE